MVTTGRRTMTCALAIAAAACAAGRQPAHAQDGRLLPETRYMPAAVADPAAPRLAASFMHTNLLATQGPERPPFALPDPAAAAQELVVAVGIGAVFPLLQLAEWEGGGAVLVADGRVFARFRFELPTRDDMGQDWYVGGGVEAAQGRWAGSVAVMHRSSHLGDEFVAETGAERIEFGGEQLDVRAAYRVPGVARLYAGGGWVFRSYLRWDRQLRELGVQDRAVVQLGADREWRPWSDPRFHVLAGADYFSAERTRWHPAYSGALGVGVRTTRSLQLVLRGYAGKSQMGEFFLTRERYLSLELAAQFQ